MVRSHVERTILFKSIAWSGNFKQISIDDSKPKFYILGASRWQVNWKLGRCSVIRIRERGGDAEAIGSCSQIYLKHHRLDDACGVIVLAGFCFTRFL